MVAIFALLSLLLGFMLGGLYYDFRDWRRGRAIDQRWARRVALLDDIERDIYRLIDAEEAWERDKVRMGAEVSAEGATGV